MRKTHGNRWLIESFDDYLLSDLDITIENAQFELEDFTNAIENLMDNSELYQSMQTFKDLLDEIYDYFYVAANSIDAAAETLQAFMNGWEDDDNDEQNED